MDSSGGAGWRLPEITGSGKSWDALVSMEVALGIIGETDDEAKESEN